MPEQATTPEPGDQPLGESTQFSGAQHPAREQLVGAYVTLRPVRAAGDAEPLYRISHPPDGDPRIWTYLYDGPFVDLRSFRASLDAAAISEDPLFFTVIVDGVPQGMVAYLAIVPEHGTLELGNIWFGPALQRTPAATEAIFLLFRHAFDDLGYRRVEWKCNALNQPSRRAAERFGFEYEGTFAQHRVVKGRNRDTAWFSITDARWPGVRAAFETWLEPSNFDDGGRQLRSLASLRLQPSTARGERSRARLQ
jgi:RimJ/RimL family protein N-acetyltransferase